ncbi:MAG: T9SS type A sorting domain-containing protein, partial [Bacteroidia bacterium]|nr:T9SS type A sorting domain-containing protein [Bacteroidia bacterium]
MKKIFPFLIALLFQREVLLSQTSLSCNDNAYCSQASPAPPSGVVNNDSRATIKVEFTNSSSPSSPYNECSCTLLRQGFSNGDDNQQQNIIITAAHCIHTGFATTGPIVSLGTSRIYFNYSNADCNPNPYKSDPFSSPSKQQRYELVGLTLIDEDPFLDIAVLKINQPIPPHFNPYYAGWSVNPITILSNDQFYNFHHPDGDIKKISSTVGALVGNNFPVPFRYNVVWQNGRTQEGSSGSSLMFNQRVIGALSGIASPVIGGENCSNTKTANFARFADFWASSGPTRGHLNPDNIFGLTGSPGGEIECYSNDLYLDGQYWPAGDYQPNNSLTIRCQNNIFLGQSSTPLIIHKGADFTFEAQNVIKANPGFSVQFGANAVLKPGMSCTAMRTVSDPYDIDSSIVQYYRPGDLQTNKKLTLSLIPNPNNGVFEVTLDQTVDFARIEVFDLQSKKIYSSEVTNFSKEKIDLGACAEGIYYVHLTGNGIN